MSGSAAQVSVYGRLVRDPVERETKTGTAMTTARLAVSVPDRTQGAEEGQGATLWLNVIAFGYPALDLAKHSQGEPVSVSGRLEWVSYKSRDGEDREAWQVVADAVISARSVRPRGGRRSPPPGRDRDRDGWTPRRDERDEGRRDGRLDS